MGSIEGESSPLHEVISPDMFTFEQYTFSSRRHLGIPLHADLADFLNREHLYATDDPSQEEENAKHVNTENIRALLQPLRQGESIHAIFARDATGIVGYCYAKTLSYRKQRAVALINVGISTEATYQQRNIASPLVALINSQLFSHRITDYDAHVWTKSKHIVTKLGYDVSELSSFRKNWGIIHMHLTPETITHANTLAGVDPLMQTQQVRLPKKGK